MAHLHTVMDDDLYFRIDPQSKSIEYLGEDPLVIAQTDHNSEYFTFEMPREIEGHDMMLCNEVEVHYINIGTDNRRSSDVYRVQDLQVSADDEDVVMFTWLISRNATMHVGSLNFVLRFACINGSMVEYSWRTGVYSGVSIVESFDHSDRVVEQYSDILQEWYMELLMAGATGVNMVAKAAEEKIEEIKQVDYVVQIEQDVLDRITAAGDQIIEDIQKEIYTGETELVDTLPVYEGDTEVIT